jgi:hypothetical protein
MQDKCSLLLRHCSHVPLLLLLLLQVLSRDIRSLHQRQQAGGQQHAALHVQASASLSAQPHCGGGVASGHGPEQAVNGVQLAGEQQAGMGAAAMQERQGLEFLGPGKYHVVLDGVDISYDCDQDGNIIVCQAQVHS